MIRVLKVMADHQLDAIVHKSVEDQLTLIKDGVNPSYLHVARTRGHHSG